MDQSQLNKLFDFGPNGGLTGRELGELFGTKQFVLILLEDTVELKFLHKTMADAHTRELVKPVRYWCGRDEASVHRLIDVLQRFSTQDISSVMTELMARVLVESDI